MHSFRACKELLISALSFVRSAECWSVSCRRSVPAQSTSTRVPRAEGSSTMQTQWEREDSSLRPWLAVARLLNASSAHTAPGRERQRMTQREAEKDREKTEKDNARQRKTKIFGFRISRA